MKNLLFTLFLLHISSCSNRIVIKDPAKIRAPFDGNKFSNLEPVVDKGFLDILKWKISSIGNKKEWPDKINNPTFKVESEEVRNGVNVIIINHATSLIQMNGMNILTDPIYSERCSPVSFFGPKRVIDPGIAWEDLPKIDIVLISHNHYDHLDLPTLKKLSRRDDPKMLVGLGNSPLLKDEGIENVLEVDWWDTIITKDVKIHFVPAQHWSARGIFDRKKTLWGGFIIEGDKKIYFAGDTGYGKIFTNIQERLGPIDISLLPIGAYEPRWFMRSYHLNPMDAVQAFIDLKTNIAIGTHFGTFKGLTDEGISEPEEDLQKALLEKEISAEKFIIPIFGKSYRL